MGLVGYYDGPTNCLCGEAEQTMNHLLVCPFLLNECTRTDLAEANNIGVDCARYWMTHI